MNIATSLWRRFVAYQNERLDVDEIQVALPQLPDALEGFRIAILADLHIAQPNAFHQSIVEAVAKARPGCILIAGDVIDNLTGAIDALTPIFAALSSIAPTVAVLGNNDCLPSRIHSLRDMYRRAGVVLLENEMRMLGVGGVPIQITGMLDPWAEKNDIKPERTTENQEYVPISKAIPSKQVDDVKIPSILLVHEPQLVHQYASLAPSLIIAGHAHGGQFRLPLVGGLYSPDQGIFPALTSGLYHISGTQLIVSRGLGNHHLMLRLNNRPHIPIAILRGAGA